MPGMRNQSSEMNGPRVGHCMGHLSTCTCSITFAQHTLFCWRSVAVFLVQLTASCRSNIRPPCVVAKGFRVDRCRKIWMLKVFHSRSALHSTIAGMGRGWQVTISARGDDASDRKNGTSIFHIRCCIPDCR